MKKNGGKRKGAGRKGVDSRRSGKAVRATADKIDNVQPLAFKTLKEGLKAMETIRIVDEKNFTKTGSNLFKNAQAINWKARIRAAEILIDKRHPDLSTLAIEGGDPDRPVFTKAEGELEKLSDIELIRFMASRAKAGKG